MKIAWSTDLHLNSVKPAEIEQFCDDVLRCDVSAILLGGDVSESNELIQWLKFLESRLRIPIFYVLGNHDYYGSDITTIRVSVKHLENNYLHYLPITGLVNLNSDVVLVGHDGWGDCRVGSLDRFEILTDYLAIRDLWETIDREDLLDGFSNRAQLRQKLNELGDEAADTLRPNLLKATKSCARVLILTHVPPFRESCWHDGNISEETWLPGFTCKAVGDLLMSVAESHPNSSFTVLCGHTHGSGYVRICPNLEVHTGFGDYGRLKFRIINTVDNQIKVDSPNNAFS
jgi:predicted MPP superfamily phosphohydrolase